MALQICVEDGTKYPGVAEDGTAAVCPSCGSDQYHSEGLEPEGWQSPAEPEPVPVAVQKEAGIPPEETVTIADQRAGVPAPDLPQDTGQATESQGL